MKVTTFVSSLLSRKSVSRRSIRKIESACRTTLESLEQRCLMSAVMTDATDYGFGQTAMITGTEFQPMEMVQLQVTHVAGTAGSNADAQNQPWQVQADANGNISSSWLVNDPDALDASYDLNATGMTSGLAAHSTFTDASQATPTRPMLDTASDTGTLNNDGVTKINTPSFHGSVRIPGLTTVTTAVTVEMWEAGSLITTATVSGLGGATVQWAMTSPVLSDGVHNLSCTAYHLEGATKVYALTSGNIAFSANTTITIDTAAPVVTFQSATTSPNANGWYKSNVIVPFTVGSDLSGVKTVSTTSPITLTSEGSAVTGSVTTTDIAGNSGTFVSPAYKIDKTAPTISAQRVTLANGNGWNNTNVDASYTASDNLALVEATTGTFTFSSEGAGQSHTFTVTDMAGNSASTTVTGVNIDKTAPTINAQRVTLANINGWNNTNVITSYSASDNLALVESATGGFTFSSEGAGQSHTFTVTDLAGNSNSASITNVNIDKTAPSINAQRVTLANANGWNNTDVVTTYSASDNLALVESPTGGFTFTAEGAAQSHTFTVTDLAGNSNSASITNVNIDKTAPTLSFSAATTSPNAAGWYNTNVTVPFTSGDALSGLVAGSPASPMIISNEGSAVTGSIMLTDMAGNSQTFTSAAFKIDKTAPNVGAVVGPDLAVPGQAATFTDNATDAVSGIAGAVWQAGAFSGSGPSFTFTPTGGGSFVVSYTVTDVAGNTATASKLMLVTGVAVIDGNLVIGGTTGDDKIQVNPNGNVSLNGVTSNYLFNGKILIFAGAGNDDVQIAGGVDKQCWIYGGDGDDRLNGGNGGNLLVGGNGNDELLGGNNNDILIGGQGADRMVGNSGDDILVAGYTAFDNYSPSTKLALEQIMAEWNSSRDYSTRIQNLTTGTGSANRVNGSSFLNKTTCFDDASDQRDNLTGSAGDDWYICNQTEDSASGMSKLEAAACLNIA